MAMETAAPPALDFDTAQKRYEAARQALADNRTDDDNPVYIALLDYEEKTLKALRAARAESVADVRAKLEAWRDQEIMADATDYLDAVIADLDRPAIEHISAVMRKAGNPGATHV